jgi:hypothetical protein
MTNMNPNTLEPLMLLVLCLARVSLSNADIQILFCSFFFPNSNSLIPCKWKHKMKTPLICESFYMSFQSCRPKALPA